VNPRAALDDLEKRKLLTLPRLEIRPLDFILVVKNYVGMKLFIDVTCCYHSSVCVFRLLQLIMMGVLVFTHNPFNKSFILCIHLLSQFVIYIKISYVRKNNAMCICRRSFL
jgi:hypothetical protein